MTNERFLRNIREFDGTKGDTYPAHVDFTQTAEEKEAETERIIDGFRFSGPDLHDFAWKTGERSARAAAHRIHREVAEIATRQTIVVS